MLTSRYVLLLPLFLLIRLGICEVLSAGKLRSLGDQALSSGDYKAAIKHYSDLIGIEETANNYYKRASVHLRQRHYLPAISDLTKSLQKDAQFALGYFHRGRAHILRGECAEGRQDFEALQKLEKDSTKVKEWLPKAIKCVELISQGKKFYEAKRYEEAKNAYQQALDIAAESPSLLLQRVKCHVESKDYQSALVDTRLLLRMEQSNVDALFLRAQAFYFLKEHENALTHLREGLRQDPEHTLCKAFFKKLKKLEGFIKSGDENTNKNHHAQAAEDFTQALAIDPDHHIIQREVGVKLCRAYNHISQSAKALEACNKVLQSNPDDLDALCEKGNAYLKMENWDEAIHAFSKATSLNQQHRPAQEGLQRAKLEQKKASRKDYYKILGVSKDATERDIKKAFRKLALQYHPDKAEGSKEEAEKIFRDIAEANDILTDPELRGRYDRGEDITEQAQQRNQGGGFPFPFGGGGGFGGGGQTFHFQWG